MCVCVCVLMNEFTLRTSGKESWDLGRGGNAEEEPKS